MVDGGRHRGTATGKEGSASSRQEDGQRRNANAFQRKPVIGGRPEQREGCTRQPFFDKHNEVQKEQHPDYHILIKNEGTSEQ